MGQQWAWELVNLGIARYQTNHIRWDQKKFISYTCAGPRTHLEWIDEQKRMIETFDVGFQNVRDKNCGNGKSSLCRNTVIFFLYTFGCQNVQEILSTAGTGLTNFQMARKESAGRGPKMSRVWTFKRRESFFEEFFVSHTECTASVFEGLIQVVAANEVVPVKR